MTYQFDITLAQKYGVDEAIFVHHLVFWIRKNEADGTNLRKGKTWTFSSAKALAQLFPFWSPRQIERIVKSCRDKGLIETEQLSDNPRDRTTWYALTETVKCIYANGEMETTKRVNGYHQTVKCIKGEDKSIKIKAEDRESTPAPETAYGEFANVKLNDEEHGKLLARYGQAKVSEYIESLSLYMESSHKHYASHYATILKWLKRDGVPETGTKKAGRYAEW